MTRITSSTYASPGCDAFTNKVGAEVTLRRDHVDERVTGTVVAADVAIDGLSALLTIDFPDGTFTSPPGGRWFPERY